MKAAGCAYLILDGTLISTDRLAETKLSKKGREIDAWFSGESRGFGGVIQALTDPVGEPVWVLEVVPGSSHDLTAARELVLAIAWHYTADMPILADGGYEGAGRGVLGGESAQDPPVVVIRSVGWLDAEQDPNDICLIVARR